LTSVIKPEAMEDDAFCTGMHELGQALFALPQRQLGAAVPRDVGDQHERALHLAAVGQVR
jgi:hypothetical protein